MSGLLHFTIGYLAIRIALGSGGGTADQSGALAAVAAKPGDIAALWVAAVAFLVMALWRLVEKALGRSTNPNPKARPRKCWIGQRPSRWRSSISRPHTPRSDSPREPGNPPVHRIRDQRTPNADRGDTIALIAAGVIIVAVGAYHVYKGASRSFLDDLKGNSSDLVRRLGWWVTSPKAWLSPAPGR